MPTGYPGIPPTAKEAAWLEYVLNPPVEPPPHKCGMCGNNPYKTSNIPCPKDPRRGRT